MAVHGREGLWHEVGRGVWCSLGEGALLGREGANGGKGFPALRKEAPLQELGGMEVGGPVKASGAGIAAFWRSPWGGGSQPPGGGGTCAGGKPEG